MPQLQAPRPSSSSDSLEARIRAVERRAERAEKSSRWLKLGAFVLVLGGLSLPFAASGLGNVPNFFSAGAPINAAQMNANFQHVVDGVTGVEDRFVASGVPALSAGSGSQSFTSNTFVTVSGMVATLSTSGNPVQVSLVPDVYDNTLASDITVRDALPSDGYLRLERNGVPLCQGRLVANHDTDISIPPSMTCVDTDATTGARSYTLSVRAGGTGAIDLRHVRIMAIELGHLQ